MPIGATKSSSTASASRAWQQLLADALEVDGAAARLGVSVLAIHEMVNDGQLAAVRLGGRLRLPAWQFSSDGLLAGMPDVVKSWPGSFLSLSMWACTPSTQLDGRTPAQALRDGDVLKVEMMLIQPAAHHRS
jgi:excisionase family DNA binding protein